jgi:hypothetical protein
MKYFAPIAFILIVLYFLSKYFETQMSLASLLTLQQKQKADYELQKQKETNKAKTNPLTWIGNLLS